MRFCSALLALLSWASVLALTWMQLLMPERVAQSMVLKAYAIFLLVAILSTAHCIIIAVGFAAANTSGPNRK